MSSLDHACPADADDADGNDVRTLQREMSHSLGLDVPLSRGRRRSSSVVLAELTRALSRQSTTRAPWNATGWRPPRAITLNELDRRVEIAREALDRYEQYNQAPRKLKLAPTDEEEAAFLARTEGTLGSTVAIDIADEKLAFFSKTAAAKKRALYESWDSRVYRPTVEEIADAVDESTAAALLAPRPVVGGKRAKSEGAAQGVVRRPSIVIRPEIPLTLRDPLKRVLVKKLEEDAITQPAETASLALPAAQQREVLPPTFWSNQKLSSTPYGHFLTQRRPTDLHSPAKMTKSRVYHNDFSRFSEFSFDARGRAKEVDAEFPKGKQIALHMRYQDTRPTVQQQRQNQSLDAASAVTDRQLPAPRKMRPVGGAATISIA